MKDLVADLAQFKPDVVVLDSLGEVMPLFRANSNSADDFTVVHTNVIKPLKQAGAAVLVVDHLPKSAESRQHGPTGTAAKTRAVGGIAVRVSVETAFRPGEGGAAKLVLFKDRHGGVRKQVQGSEPRPVIGTFTLSEHDGKLAYGFGAASAARQAEPDSQRVEDDVATLVSLQNNRDRVDTVRDVKSALKCGQARADAALAAFRYLPQPAVQSAA